MKYLFVVIVCVLASKCTAQKFALNNCSSIATKKAPAVLKSGIYYQLMRDVKVGTGKRNDDCYNMKVTPAGLGLNIIQSLMYQDVNLNHTFTANSNNSGTWDIAMNGKLSSQVVVLQVSTFLVVLGCQVSYPLYLQPGIYSPNKKALDKATLAKIKASMKFNAFIDKNVEVVNQSKCKN